MAKNKKRTRKNKAPVVDEERTDVMEFEGIVEDAMPGTLFRVKCDTGHSVICVLAGKLRQHRIRVNPGDRVTFEVSPYDVTRGRITWRS
jgi:translation initiation factor IF-1